MATSVAAHPVAQDYHPDLSAHAAQGAPGSQKPEEKVPEPDVKAKANMLQHPVPGPVLAAATKSGLGTIGTPKTAAAGMPKSKGQLVRESFLAMGIAANDPARCPGCLAKLDVSCCEK